MTTANERRLQSVMQQIHTTESRRDALSDELARLHLDRGNLEYAIKVEQAKRKATEAQEALNGP